MKKMKAFAIALALMTTTSAVAQESVHGGFEELGVSKDWTAIRYKSASDGGALRCAIFSRPKSSRVIEGDAEVDALRGERAAFITWEDGMSVSPSTGVASFLMGAPIVAKDAGHYFEVTGGSRYDLYGFQDRAYPREADDVDVLKSIRVGASMTVRSKLSETRMAEDQYSLYGVQSATALAAKACN